MKVKFNLVFFSFVIFTFFSIVFVGQNSFGVMYEDTSGEATYFVSKTIPTIHIEISSGTKDIIVDKGKFYFENEIKEFDVVENRELGKFGTGTYDFSIEEDVSKLNNAKFKLIVYDKETSQFITPMGDPIDFNIVYDNIKPDFVEVTYDFSETNKYLILEFSEILKSLKVDFNGKKLIDVDIQNNPEMISSKIVKINVNDIVFDEEGNMIEMSFEDLAENQNTASKDIYSPGTELDIKLLTLKDDDSLKYYYNSEDEFKALFAKSIYSSSSNFELKIKTTKKANCYFYSGVDTSSGFPEIGEVRSKMLFSSENNLIHTFSVSTSIDKKIWVACQSISELDEVVYLSESLGFGKDLVNLKSYSGGDLKILMSEPTSLVSNVPFSLFVDTNNKAVCFYSVGGNQNGVLNSSNFINHQKGGIVTAEGKTNVKFECEDVLGNKKSVQKNIDVDPSKGVKILDYEPKYTSSSDVNVEFFLSEFKDVSCKYSLTRRSSTDFDLLNNISSNEIARNKGTFKITGLHEGENEIFVYCKKIPEIVENSIKILYDTKGVVISNFSFVSGNYKSDFVSSNKELKFEFLTTSIIPVKTYVVEVFDNLGKVIEKKNFTTSTYSLSGDFSNATKLKITGSNEIGINGSFEKNIVFDLTTPLLDVTFIDGNLKIICVDYESGCSEKFYGLADTQGNCQANKKYENENIETQGKKFLCVEAFNYAGLKATKIQSLTNEVINNLVPSIEPEENKTQEEINESSDSTPTQNEDEVEYFKDDPFNSTDVQNPNNSGSMNYILIAAIVLLFAGVGGGGFYAYKKGYLDKELDKLGLKLNRNKKLQTNITTQVSKTHKPINKIQKNVLSSKNKIKQIIPKFENKKKVEESSYDKHLKKLNKFIDDKVSRSKGAFDKFDTIPKGNTKGYEDSMTVRNKDRKINEDDFDEFYKKSKLETTIEKETDSFEVYQKKKKK